MGDVSKRQASARETSGSDKSDAIEAKHSLLLKIPNTFRAVLTFLAGFRFSIAAMIMFTRG